MFAALRGHYVQFVIFMGVAERYPDWFIEEISNRIFVNESRYCFWTSPPERQADYYEKELIETYSVVVRKPGGETHIMDVVTFEEMYCVFKFDLPTNSGIAAFNNDVIEYVECHGGGLLDHYPEWFYEYFTESLNNPKDSETYLFSINDNGYLTVSHRCVFLRNRFGEIRYLSYDNFVRHYDPDVNWLWLDDCPF